MVVSDATTQYFARDKGHKGPQDQYSIYGDRAIGVMSSVIRASPRDRWPDTYDMCSSLLRATLAAYISAAAELTSAYNSLTDGWHVRLPIRAYRGSSCHSVDPTQAFAAAAT